MLSDRFGLRRVVPVSACLVALGLVLASQAQTLWMFYLAYGVIFAMGSCGLGELSHVPLIARWFVRKRGTAISIAMAGMGLGILLIVPLAQACILAFGWRWSYIVLATIVVVGVIPPTLLWQRERPEDVGLRPDGDIAARPTRRPPLAAARQTAPARARHEWTLRGALRTPTLWLLFAMRIFTPLGMMMVVPHHVAYLIGQGFSKPTAALAFGALGIFSFTGRIVFGSLSDRLGQITTIILTYSITIVGTLLLLALHDPSHTWLLWGHIVVYGLGFGARGPVTSALVTQLFHGKHWGAILGFLEIGSGLGGTIGPAFSGLLFDWTGSYTWSFSLSMLMLALAVVCAWLAGRHWHGDPQE
jgi:MFS family permease